jgi:DNA-binding NarL/FixJ family response regulator
MTSSNAGLTVREAAVLRFVVWGYTHKEIACRLAISVKTVETHKANAMRKLKFGRRSELVQYAVSGGWFAADSAPVAGDPPRANGTATATDAFGS